MDMQIADFQAAYKKHGPFNLEEQVPYLCKLADRYKLLYERNDHWMDCLKVSYVKYRLAQPFFGFGNFFLGA